MHETDRYRVEEVALLAPDLDGRHRPAFQDSQVLHDPEPRHLRQVLAQLPKRLAIALEEPIEQLPPIASARARKSAPSVPSWSEYM